MKLPKSPDMATQNHSFLDIPLIDLNPTRKRKKEVMTMRTDPN